MPGTYSPLNILLPPRCHEWIWVGGICDLCKSSESVGQTALPFDIDGTFQLGTAEQEWEEMVIV